MSLPSVARIARPSTQRRGAPWLYATVAGAMLALAGCGATVATTPQVESLTSAHYAPTQTVDVLSVAPTAGYERLARLQLADPTGVATRSQLVAQLADAAKALGANALIVESATRANTAVVGFNPAGGQMQDSGDTGALAVTAVAIRYTH